MTYLLINLIFKKNTFINNFLCKDQNLERLMVEKELNGVQIEYDNNSRCKPDTIYPDYCMMCTNLISEMDKSR